MSSSERGQMKKFRLSFGASLDAFKKALWDIGWHIAMPPEWVRFWTKGPRGLTTLRLADSLFFTDANFYDVLVAFERRGKTVHVVLDGWTKVPERDKAGYYEVNKLTHGHVTVAEPSPHMRIK